MGRSFVNWQKKRADRISSAGVPEVTDTYSEKSEPTQTFWVPHDKYDLTKLLTQEEVTIIWTLSKAHVVSYFEDTNMAELR